MATATEQSAASITDIENAAQHLRTSRRGRESLKTLWQWMAKGDGIGLDAVNQECVYTLLEGLWGPLVGTTLEVLHETLEAK